MKFLITLALIVCLAGLCTAQGMIPIGHIFNNELARAVTNNLRSGFNFLTSLISGVFSFVTGGRFDSRSVPDQQREEQEQRYENLLDQGWEELKNDLKAMKGIENLLTQELAEEGVHSEERANSLIKDMQGLVKFYQDHMEKVRKLKKDAQIDMHMRPWNTKHLSQAELHDTKKICLFKAVEFHMNKVLRIIRSNKNNVNLPDLTQTISKIKSSCEIADRP